MKKLERTLLVSFLLACIVILSVAYAQNYVTPQQLAGADLAGNFRLTTVQPTGACSASADTGRAWINGSDDIEFYCCISSAWATCPLDEANGFFTLNVVSDSATLQFGDDPTGADQGFWVSFTDSTDTVQTYGNMTGISYVWTIPDTPISDGSSNAFEITQAEVWSVIPFRASTVEAQQAAAGSAGFFADAAEDAVLLQGLDNTSNREWEVDIDGEMNWYDDDVLAFTFEQISATELGITTGNVVLSSSILGVSVNGSPTIAAVAGAPDGALCNEDTELGNTTKRTDAQTNGCYSYICEDDGAAGWQWTCMHS